MARASKTVKKTKPTKKIPARAAAPEKGFMSDGLLVELEAIAEDSRVDELRANILSHLKNKLTQAKALAREALKRRVFLQLYMTAQSKDFGNLPRNIL